MHPSLLADMRLALLGEFGAREVYRRLARRSRDADLCGVLGGLHEEQVEQVERLRELLAELGARTPNRSRRRALAAMFLTWVSWPLGVRFALRICHDAETTISRWYQAYAGYLARHVRPDAARECERLSLTKRRHALVLQTWIDHGRRLGG